jgi:single-strand DNA-binding protein
MMTPQEGSMLNQIVLVGKVLEMPQLRETNKGHKVVNLLIAVQRNFRNSVGEYESDAIMCTLWRGVAESVSAVCEVGSLVGIKGRLQANCFESKDQRPFHYCEVIAEKVSFLSPKAG